MTTSAPRFFTRSIFALTVVATLAPRCFASWMAMVPTPPAPAWMRTFWPPDADLIASYGEFTDSLTRPGLLPRAMALGALAADKGLDVEYQLGEYLGLINQNL